jgi:hypothetical protein
VPSEFVPDEFVVPLSFDGRGFRLEPLGPKHNERDYAAWMSSVDHIRSTPGFEDWDWPTPMTLDENRNDLVDHADDFENRSGFTYSILDDDEVLGCVYIYPSTIPDVDAHVRSWVTELRSELDVVVWSALSQWLEQSWPFRNLKYSVRS